MGKRNPPKRRTDLSRTQSAAYFLRLMERQRDRRSALSIARGAVDAATYRDVLPKLMANPTYRWATVADPFPLSPTRIQKRPQLHHIDIRREFIWSGEVLRLWEDQLRDFVRIRVCYEDDFLSARYDKAKKSLDLVETRFGWSTWLVASRIQLLAISEGLQAQKAFLEDFLAQDISPLLGWVSYYYSLRSEENYSLASIEQVLEETRHNQSLYDYATYHLNPYSITQIGEAKHLLSWEEVNPLIDRLQAHLVSSRIYLSGNEIDADSREAILDSLQAIRGIQDPSIDTLLGCSDSSRTVGVFDRFVAGLLPADVTDAFTPPEVVAAAALQTGQLENLGTESVIGQIANCMTEMLLPRDSYIRNRQQLQKLALVCGHLTVTREISSFISRRDAEAPEMESMPPQRYASLGETSAELCLPSFADNTHIDLQGRPPPNTTENTSLVVARAILDKDAAAIPEDASPWLATLYRSHIHLSLSELDDAEKSFGALSQSLVPYMICVARVGLFRCSLARNDAVAAAAQAVTHSLQSPDIFRLYPFASLAQRVKGNPILTDPLLKATLLHFASKIDGKWQVELSDAYENVLHNFKCERPSQLDGFGKTEIETYFLRNICIQRIMEDSTAFKSIEQVETERIAICQRLLEVDPENTQIYADEIKTITRDQNVSALLHHVESNMVYVDSGGVSSVVRDSLKESFERYQILVASPSLEYQAEQISKMIKGLMNKLRDADARDIATPASSEKAGLFEQMRNYFIDTFALHPAFGLDTNLSTSIRHGVIEGHIRAAFAQEQLLSNWDSTGQLWVLPDQWRERLTSIPASERIQIEKSFGRFASRLGDLVKLYRDELVQIRRVETKRQGLFFFNANPDELRALSDSVGTSTSYEEFLAQMFDHGWTLVDRSMAEVKIRIRGDLLSSLNAATKNFATSLSEVPAARNAGLLNAITRGQTAMQVKIEEIANWFKRPTDVSDTPFEIELAVLVALKQVENCFTGQPLHAMHSIQVASKFPGTQLNGFVEVIFLFLQNSIKHGGFGPHGRQTSITIDIREDGDDLLMEFSNDVAPELDLAEMKKRADEAVARNLADSDLSIAPTEGRSGLSKLKRILRFDIRRDYDLDFQFETDPRQFKATLRIHAEGARYADLHSRG